MFFPTASFQDVHILSDAVQALLHLFQHFLSESENGSPTNAQRPAAYGRQTCWAAPSAAPTNTASGAPLVQTNVRHPASGWSWK